LSLSAALLWWMGGSPDGASLTLPVGLPWLGAPFRIDSLASFFLVVVNLGGAAARLYGLGYGGHVLAPHRVLPFFPAFLAGMNLVVLADDAFSYLLCWEFMSLASWALVMAHHREAGNAKAGYIYLVMASFGTLALLLAFGLLAGPAGDYGFAAIRAAQHTPYVATLVLILMLLGAGSKAGLVPLHVWLALAPTPPTSHLSHMMRRRRAQPRFSIDERRHYQGRGLRLHPRHLRLAGAAGLVGERGRALPRWHHRG